MLEDRACLVSRDYSRSKLFASKDKRPVHQMYIVSPIGGIVNSALAQSVMQSRSRRHAGENSNTTSLIGGIGRDLSISCLIKCSRADYGAIASLNRSFQSLIRTGELYRLRRQNKVAEHWVYLSCQLLEWEAFDPCRRRWMRLPRMDPDDCFVFADTESLAVGTELVFGRDLRALQLRVGDMDDTPEHEKIYVVGRIGGADNVLLTCGEEYNLDTQTWTEIPNMSPVRTGAARDNEPPATSEAPPLIAVVNNQLYAADHADMEIRRYEKDNRVWVTVGRLPERADSM
ncbi:hypothetical protein SASPL_133228 [Salvia splendens]|uniref:Uncharacterized protein n=1 Tax=Salvia splendens TaxID=180675 RepID=A0A8X8X2B3_SALSN|nr:hypothetical protein SASPL_133228 [Salvia splendens]